MLEGGLKGASRGLYIRGLGMCKVCTEAVHSIPKHFEHELHQRFGHV